MIQPLPSAVESGALDCVVFDFDGVFTDNFVWVSQDGQESVKCWRGDGLGLERLRDLGFPCFVLSTEVNAVVSARCQKLKIPCRQGLAEKGEALQQLAEEQGFELSKMVYVGNDINDATCLRRVGYPVLVSDAHPAVLPLGKYQTVRPGGFGAVREVCEWLVGILTRK